MNKIKRNESQPIKEGKEFKGGHHKYRPKTKRPNTIPKGQRLE